MATQAALTNGVEAGRAIVSEEASRDWSGEMRYVARQPILNLQGHVHGYELLFRHAPNAVLNQGVDTAARTMLDNAVMFGQEWLTNGLPAFVKCTVESLTEDLVLVLSPHKTVLAIPGNLELTPRLLDSCRKLKARGFRLSLENFSWNADLEPLIRLADYIRVDFNRLGSEELQHLRALYCDSIARVAQKVETQEDYRQARGGGFTLFQGSYICNPVLVKRRNVPANRLLHFEIVRELHHDPIEVRKLGKLVMQDASLTYRLLRLVNSPLYATRKELRSIESAIIILGDDTLRRVISLAVLSEMNGGQPPEILNMALLRARFCELAADLCGLEPAEQYLLGMFSLVPAMLGMAMKELTPLLPLREAIRESLVGKMNHERSLLAWVESLEGGDWEACDLLAEGIGASRSALMRYYGDSAVWSEASLRSAV